MNYIQHFWNKFKQEPDIWFFYGFLLTFTLTIRKVIYFFPIKNQFNEYTGIYLYHSDIFLFLVFSLWLFVIFKHNITFLSSGCSWFTQYAKVTPRYVVLPFFIVVYSLISILWSFNEYIAFFKFIKLFEYYLLFFFIVFRFVPRETSKGNELILRNFILIITATAFFHSLVSIYQFIFQKSLGLYFLGESHISSFLPGVAKLQFGDLKVMRSYGLFPHPNILGGFLLFSLILTCLLIKIQQNNHTPSLKSSTWNILITHFFVPRGTLLLKVSLVIQIIGLCLSFSKSAILGLFVSTFTIFVFYALYREKYALKTFLGSNIWLKLFHVKHFRYFFIIFLCFLTFSVLISQYGKLNISQSILERTYYLTVSRETIRDNLFLGVGSGQFIFNMLQTHPEIETWRFQPVHNVLLLILSELGVANLLIFLYFLKKLFHVEQFEKIGLCFTWNNNEIYIKSILAGFIVIMFFDHYFWDIQQGSYMLWITFGLIVGVKKCSRQCIQTSKS